MTIPPTRIAHGIVLRGFWISSPMALPASTPQNAKKTPDQKTALSRDKRGVRVVAVNCVAEPNLCHENAAIKMSTDRGTRLPMEQMLLSHLPESTPRTLSTTVMVSQKAANAMK